MSEGNHTIDLSHLLKRRLMPNPAIIKKSKAIRNKKPGLKYKPDIIPKQTGKPIRERYLLPQHRSTAMRL